MGYEIEDKGSVYRDLYLVTRDLASNAFSLATTAIYQIITLGIGEALSKKGKPVVHTTFMFSASLSRFQLVSSSLHILPI